MRVRAGERLKWCACARGVRAWLAVFGAEICLRIDGWCHRVAPADFWCLRWPQLIMCGLSSGGW